MFPCILLFTLLAYCHGDATIGVRYTGNSDSLIDRSGKNITRSATRTVDGTAVIIYNDNTYDVLSDNTTFQTDLTSFLSSNVNSIVSITSTDTMFSFTKTDLSVTCLGEGHCTSKLCNNVQSSRDTFVCIEDTTNNVVTWGYNNDHIRTFSEVIDDVTPWVGGAYIVRFNNSKFSIVDFSPINSDLLFDSVNIFGDYIWYIQNGVTHVYRGSSGEWTFSNNDPPAVLGDSLIVGFSSNFTSFVIDDNIPQVLQNFYAIQVYNDGDVTYQLDINGNLIISNTSNIDSRVLEKIELGGIDSIYDCGQYTVLKKYQNILVIDSDKTNGYSTYSLYNTTTIDNIKELGFSCVLFHNETSYEILGTSLSLTGITYSSNVFIRKDNLFVIYEPSVTAEVVTYSPTYTPTVSPTHSPTTSPSQRPTFSPTNYTSISPTRSPTPPTKQPTNEITYAPTKSPTKSTGNIGNSPGTIPTAGPSSPENSSSGKTIFVAAIGTIGGVILITLGYLRFVGKRKL